MESHAFHIASSYHNQQNLYREYNKYAASFLLEAAPYNI